MGDRYIYGELGGSLIFLRQETVELVTQLWSSVASARSWSEVRDQVGDALTFTLMQMAEFVSPTTEVEPPFKTDSVRHILATGWTSFYLMQLMTFELPFMVKEAGDMRYCPRRGGYLVIPPSQESRVVLALVSEGAWADRDDASISKCIPITEDVGRMSSEMQRIE